MDNSNQPQSVLPGPIPTNPTPEIKNTPLKPGLPTGIIVLIVVLALIVFGGYFLSKSMPGLVLEKVFENAGVGKVNVDFSNKSRDVDIKIPSSFPDDVPIYPGSKTITTTENKSGSAVQFSIGLQIEDEDMQEVVDYYKIELDKSGWSDQSSQSFQTSVILIYTKEKRQLVVSISSESGSKIQVNLTTNQP